MNERQTDPQGPCQTPIEDLRKAALDHYDEAASKALHWSSDIPRAINFYYDHLEWEQRRISDFWGLIISILMFLVGVALGYILAI